MKMPFIDLKSQYLDLRQTIDGRIQRVLDHGQYILGPEVREMEAALEKLVSARHCISVSSGTEALLISLMALGVGPGDEVITTPFTFAATVEVILLLGATPVFVDVESDTCNINAVKIEPAITKKTKAILPVSLYGQPADMDVINAVACRNGNIPVIEDGAQSFGAQYGARKSCSLSTIGCTSFFPSKPLGCFGDGGAIFTDQDDLAQICREIRVHGQSRRYTHTRLGVGGRMDTIQCAIILAKLERFGHEIKKRIEIGARYNEAFDGVGIPRVVQRANRTSVFAQYTIIVPGRDAIQERLTKLGIPTAVHYPVPMNQQPAYRAKCVLGSTPIADRLASTVLSLPMGPYLTMEQQDSVVGSIVQKVDVSP